MLGLIKQIRNKVVAYFVQPQSLQSGSSSGKGAEGKMIGSVKGCAGGFGGGSSREYRGMDGDAAFLRSEGKFFGF